MHIMSTIQTTNSNLIIMPEVVCSNQRVNKTVFTLKTFPVTLIVSHLFYSIRGCLILVIPAKVGRPRIYRGGTRVREHDPTEKNKTIHARISPPHAPLFPELFYFFAGISQAPASRKTPELNKSAALSTDSLTYSCVAEASMISLRKIGVV
jgi:hypothetical protein